MGMSWWKGYYIYIYKVPWGGEWMLGMTWGNTLGNNMGAIKTTRNARKTFFSLVH
jgi:hypothetical protein